MNRLALACLMVPVLAASGLTTDDAEAQLRMALLAAMTLAKPC